MEKLGSTLDQSAIDHRTDVASNLCSNDWREALISSFVR